MSFNFKSIPVISSELLLNPHGNDAFVETLRLLILDPQNSPEASAKNLRHSHEDV